MKLATDVAGDGAGEVDDDVGDETDGCWRGERSAAGRGGEQKRERELT